MSLRRDQYQLDIQFITDENRAFAKTVQDNRTFVKDLKNAQKEGKGVAEVMNRIAAVGKKVEGLDLNKVAPAQLIARARQLRTILNQIPDSAPGAAKLRDEYKQINNQLAQLRARSKGVVQEGSGLSSFFGSLKTRLLGAFAAGGALISVLGKITSTAADFQRFDAVLTNALGSRSEAQKAIKQLTEFAARTPFQVDELISSYVKFVNRGLKPTEAELENLADLAASQGKSFDQLAEAVLDAGTGEFERLKEFGIRAKTVGDQVQLSFKGQTIEVEKNQEAINKAIIGFGDLNGVQGSTAAISATLGGRISNLQDRFTRLFLNLGEGFVGSIISGAIEGVSRLVGFLGDLTEKTEDVTAATRSEQAEFNTLIETLKRGNVTNETRARILDTLNSKYKDYLPALLTEKSSIEDIEAAQTSANKAFAQRILLLAAEDELSQVAKRQIRLKAEELELQTKLTEAEAKRSQQSRLSAAQGGLSANSQDFAGNREQNAAAALTAAEVAVQRNIEAQKQLQDEFEQSIKAATDLGLNVENILNPPTESSIDSGGGGKRKTLEERLKEELAAAAEQFGIRQEKLDQLLLEVEINEADHGRRLVELQRDNYVEQLRLYEKYGQDRTLAAEKLRTELLKTDQLLNRADVSVSTIAGGAAPEGVEQRSIDQGLNEIASEEERAQRRLQEALNAQSISVQQYELGKLELKRQTLEAEIELLRSGTEEEIRLAAEKRDRLTEIDQSIFEQKRDIAQRRIDLEQQVRDATTDALSEGVGAIASLLGKDEEARKRNAVAIKAFEAGRILVAGFSEISQIRLAAAAQAALNPALAPLIAARTTGQTIAAGIRTATGVAQVLSAKFAQGGIAKSGFFGGRSHAAGGTKGYFDDGTVIEVERDEAFAVVNKRSSGLLRQLSAVNQLGGGVPFFNNGGLLAPNTTPVSGIGNSGVNDGALLAEMQMLRRAFAAYPTNIRAYVPYTDIETTADELNTVRNQAEV